MGKNIIGREAEIVILEALLHSKEAELLAVYGRRRVGKTFLIKNYFQQHMVFSCTGQLKGKKEEQLWNFTRQLNAYFPRQARLPIPENWQQAFYRLADGLSALKGSKKKVIFLDELPWFDSPKSGFLSAFGYFWNTCASARPDIIVAICGSATSWIIEKVINDRGGLHNRVTKRIRLQPFSLKETQQFLLHKNIRPGYYDLLQLYMVVGGIPAYLNEVQRGKSIAQNIEAICFSKDGILAGEFNNLYNALFTNAGNHIQVIRALAKKTMGLTRENIRIISKLPSGGTLTKTLNELDESGFIQKIYPFDKKEKESLYRLTDEFSLFYFKFMYDRKLHEKDQWITQQASPAYKSWCGYAFENICIKHTEQIKRALQIGGVHTHSTSWVHRGEDGAQIDLLIDRADHCINICEAKFGSSPFVIDKKYAAVLNNKLMAFRMQTRTKKNLFLTFISTYGITDNLYRQQLVDSEIKMEALFV